MDSQDFQARSIPVRNLKRPERKDLRENSGINPGNIISEYEFLLWLGLRISGPMLVCRVFESSADNRGVGVRDIPRVGKEAGTMKQERK